MGTTPQQSLGKRGEAIAAKFLQKKGYEIVYQNFHAQGGEIDIIAKDPQKREYVFVEVKTRASATFGAAVESITLQKYQKMLSAIEDFFARVLQMSPAPLFRIDAVVLQVQDGKAMIQHLEGIGPDDFEGADAFW